MDQSVCVARGHVTVTCLVDDVTFSVLKRLKYEEEVLRQSMNVHFLSGCVMLCIQQSHYVGRTTMPTHLLCSLPKKLLPTRSQRVLTVHHPQCPHAQCIIEMTARKGLCEMECGCQNFPKLKSCCLCSWKLHSFSFIRCGSSHLTRLSSGWQICSSWL